MTHRGSGRGPLRRNASWDHPHWHKHESTERPLFRPQSVALRPPRLRGVTTRSRHPMATRSLTRTSCSIVPTSITYSVCPLGQRCLRPDAPGSRRPHEWDWDSAGPEPVDTTWDPARRGLLNAGVEKLHLDLYGTQMGRSLTMSISLSVRRSGNSGTKDELRSFQSRITALRRPISPVGT